ncbi:MAG TPA: FAD-dependent oxidoreductase [Edaphobacter sp.]|nr:FAD-dependent oxidoreductase [Edaphobacter sp.]
MKSAVVSFGKGQRLFRFVGITGVALVLSAPTFAAPHARQAVSARVLDILRVQAEGDASKAVVTLPAGPEQVHRCDAVIIGGGMGGVSAAYEAARAGLSVCMTEPTLWIGGQMTSEGVSAFDDNKWIDTTGASKTYADLSQRIREFYYAKTKASTKAPHASLANFNPGNCWVSRLCFEPKPAVEVLQSMLQPQIEKGRLKVWVHTVPVRVDRQGRKIESVQAYDLSHKTWLRLEGKYFVDATEWGDLLPLSDLPFRVGAEAKSETHERNAADKADPLAVQSFTYPFILLNAPKAAPAGAQPPNYNSLKDKYSFVVDYGHGKFLTYGMFSKNPGTPGSFWNYRRSVDAAQYRPGTFAGDLSMINWDSNDYCDARLLSNDPVAQATALQGAKRLSLGFAWWLQHDVPRDDHHGHGYPQLELQAAAMGSSDGLAQQPYIRESRRIIPIRTIVEEDLAVDFQKGARAALYPDSVGIGQYAIDIHSCAHKDFTSATKPYEIPLGALIARDVDNLLAASKDIGTTHISNGAYRLHPTEWSVGEAVGATIAWAVQHRVTPAAIDRDPSQLSGLQRLLVGQGHPIFWFDDVTLRSPYFQAAQFTAARGWLLADASSLHFMASAPVTGGDAENALQRAGLLPPGKSERLHGIEVLTWGDLRKAGLPTSGASESGNGTVNRGDFAVWLLAHAQRR